MTLLMEILFGNIQTCTMVAGVFDQGPSEIYHFGGNDAMFISILRAT